MNEQQLDKWFKTLTDGLTALMGKMQMSAEKLFEWGLKNNYAEACFSGFVIFLAILALWAVYKFWSSDFPKNNEDGMGFFVFVSAFVTISASATILICARDIVFRLISPELSTLKDFAQIIGGLK